MSPLPHLILGADAPARTALVLHGILGSKTNWRTLIRKLSGVLPGWGFVLPDLRNHGDALGLAGPHTLDAVCDDLAALRAHLGRPFDAVIGHSYGGKATLAWVEREAGDLDVAVILDASPGARPDRRGSETTMRSLEALGALGPTFAKRDDFVRSLTAQGFTLDLAMWLAMNLVPEGDGYRLRTDLAAIRAMLDDFFARDLWSPLESPPGRVTLWMVLGGDSPSLDADDRERLLRAQASAPTRLRCEVVRRAGHWVHVDAPGETAGILAQALGGT